MGWIMLQHLGCPDYIATALMGSLKAEAGSPECKGPTLKNTFSESRAGLVIAPIVSQKNCLVFTPCRSYNWSSFILPVIIFSNLQYGETPINLQPGCSRVPSYFCSHRWTCELACLMSHWPSEVQSEAFPEPFWGFLYQIPPTFALISCWWDCTWSLRRRKQV